MCPPCASIIDLQIGNPRPMPLDFVVKNGLNSCSACLRIESRSGICNSDHDGIGLIDARFNTQRSRAMFGSGHGFDCIRDQIQNDLLQLTRVGHHIRGWVVGEIRFQHNSIGDNRPCRGSKNLLNKRR